jgi:hypothetical protein
MYLPNMHTLTFAMRPHDILLCVLKSYTGALTFARTLRILSFAMPGVFQVLQQMTEEEVLGASTLAYFQASDAACKNLKAACEVRGYHYLVVGNSYKQAEKVTSGFRLDYIRVEHSSVA